MANRTDSTSPPHLTGGRALSGSVDWLRIAAIGAIGLDAVTTWYILVADGYRELNPLILAAWIVHPLVVAAYFGGFGLCVWLVTRRNGWLSTAVAIYVVLIMGVSGGLNNLILFAFGPPSLIDLLGQTLALPVATLILGVIPAWGLTVAVVVAGVWESRVQTPS